MKTLFPYISLLIVLTFGSNCYASKPYLDENRIAYISNVLQAFSETTNHNIFNTHSYINVVETNNCRSNLSDLRTECLLSYAKRNCSEAGNLELRNNCELFSDVIVVNKLSENNFVKRSERYRLLKNTNDDYRTAMASRLQQKYARIVTHFSLTKGSYCDNKDYKCLAKGMDQFCLDYTNAQSLSWQHCISAMLWFIGTSKKD